MSALILLFKIEELRNILEEQFPAIAFAYLFGSSANGAVRPGPTHQLTNAGKPNCVSAARGDRLSFEGRCRLNAG